MGDRRHRARDTDYVPHLCLCSVLVPFWPRESTGSVVAHRWRIHSENRLLVSDHPASGHATVRLDDADAFFVGSCFHCVQLRLKRVGLNAAHYFTDKLHLPTAGFMLFSGILL